MESNVVTDAGVEAMLTELGANEVELSAPDVQKMLFNYRREAGVTEFDSPAVSSEKVRAAVAEDLGNATFELTPAVKREMAAQQESYNQLSKLTNSGFITRQRAAEIWNERHGKR